MIMVFVVSGRFLAIEVRIVESSSDSQSPTYVVTVRAVHVVA